jgi:ABC-type Zn2+ transport system substrate-binding protein/surface adhesin
MDRYDAQSNEGVHKWYGIILNKLYELYVHTHIHTHTHTHTYTHTHTHTHTHTQGNYAVHKWYGIILNKVSEFQGTSATIKNSFFVKQHWAKVPYI